MTCLGRLLALLALCAASWAHAANLQISPVNITLQPGQNAAALTLQNLGDHATYGQVRVFAWDQRDGDDALDPTRELVASPPIVQIAPQGSQVIRLVLTAPATSARAYRVWIDEVQRNEDGASAGVDIRLRYSVPVFVRTAQQQPEQLDWTLTRRDGAWWLQLRNSGGTHAQIGSMSFTNQAGAELAVSKGLFGYVLPGRSRSWRLPLPDNAALEGTVQINSTVNGRALRVETTAVLK